MLQGSKYDNEQIAATRLFYAIGVDLIEQAMYYLGLPVKHKLRASLEDLACIKNLVTPLALKVLKEANNFGVKIDKQRVIDILSQRILKEYYLKTLAY